jgi:hypothetical protein
MKKGDVEIYRDRGSEYPSINVKHYGSFDSDKVVDKLKCSEEQAEKALQFAWESACSAFWEDVEGYAIEVWGSGRVKVYGLGRSGGHLCVYGLPSVESWDAVELGRWAKFEKMVKAELKNRTDPEAIMEDIEMNEWYKDGSEQYNFFEGKDGVSNSIPDLKAAAIKAGFGPGVRK